MSLRKLLAFICLLGLLSAALSPSGFGILPAILVPLLLCVATLALAFACSQSEILETPSSICLSVVALRAPPASR